MKTSLMIFFEVYMFMCSAGTKHISINLEKAFDRVHLKPNMDWNLGYSIDDKCLSDKIKKS
jgi:hypothetical protein